MDDTLRIDDPCTGKIGIAPEPRTYGHLDDMYGPPSDCKGKVGESAQMYSAFGWSLALLAMMSCARAYAFKSVGR